MMPRLRSAWIAAVAALAIAGTSAAAPFDVLDAVQDFVTLDGARAIAPSPDGAHVYVATFIGASVAGFAIDGATGTATPTGVVTDGIGGVDGMAGCADVAVSPDGAHVYAAGFNDDAIAIFTRDAGTGALTFVDAVFDADLPSSGLNGPSGVVVSPDGAHVYVTAGVGDTVAAFARDDATGMLTLIEIETNVPSRLLDDPADLAISPDGALVYVISQGFTSQVAADSLMTFARDDQTGALTQIDVEQNLVAGVDGLELPNAVVASSDGRHVYTASGLSDSIAFFGRSAIDDSTTWIGLVRDTAPGVDGLNGATGIAITPDGGWVMASGIEEDAVAFFRRDATTSLLSFERAIRDDSDAGLRLDGVIDVAADPLGRFFYAAAFVEDSLIVFAPEPGALAAAAVAWLALAARAARSRRRVRR